METAEEKLMKITFAERGTTKKIAKRIKNMNGKSVTPSYISQRLSGKHSNGKTSVKVRELALKKYNGVYLNL